MNLHPQKPLSAPIDHTAKWSEPDLAYEHSVIFNTRLGLMTDGKPATERQIQAAKIEADAAVRGLRRG